MSAESTTTARIALVARSAAMRAVVEDLTRAASTDATVLLLGETGTGKEVLAQELHARSRRAAGPFLAVNCGTFSPSLLESELFGHVRGAFTGAVADKEGLFAAARGGTLFLDEIGELPATVQVALLRVLQERRIRRVGDTQERPVDVRIVAATHRDLTRLVSEGRFRADLLYRLQVVTIAVPPLRARPEDFATLVQQLASSLAARHGRPFAITAEAEAVLARRDWPGNVRELANFLESLLVLCPVAEVGAAEITAHASRNQPTTDQADAGRASADDSGASAASRPRPAGAQLPATRPAATGASTLARWAIRWWRFPQSLREDGVVVYERPVALLERPDRTTPLHLGGGTVRVGRAGQADGVELALEGDEVSRQHALFSERDDALVLEDLGSTNGTFVDGVQLAPRTPAPLRSGALLRMGREWLGVLLDAEAGPLPPLPLPPKRAIPSLTLDECEQLWLSRPPQKVRPSALTAAMIAAALEKAGGEKREAARLLSISPTSLYERMKELGLGGAAPRK